MNTTIFIPKVIKVGYQTRSDTYTKSLGYVIYYDQHNKLRKETSWQSWRDKKIEPQDFENVPTSGFVLNKKVGDYSNDWNHRSAACRVYDPRNFEFEITIENLLYILQNTNSIKGKGLEGDFVYGWAGSDMLLIPVDSPDYVKIEEFTNMVAKPELFKGKDLVLGGMYRTKQNEDWMYLGRFERYNSTHYADGLYGKPEGLYYYFYNGKFQTIKSLSAKIVLTVSKEPAANYAEVMDKLTHKDFYSPLNKGVIDWILYTEEEVDKLTNNGYYCAPYIYFNGEYRPVSIRKYKGYFLDISDYSYYRTINSRYDTEIKLYAFHKTVNPNNDMSLKEICATFNFYKRVEYLMNGQTKE
jgi:hypothetical protein